MEGIQEMEEEEDELQSDEEDKGYLDEKFRLNLIFQILIFFYFYVNLLQIFF